MAGRLFQSTLALLFAPKPWRQRLFGNDFPGTIDMNAYLPLVLNVTVIVALAIEMIGKFDDYIDTPARVINQFNAVLLMAIAVGGSVWWRPLYASMLMAR